MDHILAAYRGDALFERYYKMWNHDPSSIVFVPLAELLVRDGFYKEAQSICEVGLKHHRNSVSGRLVLASIYTRLGRHQDAERVAWEVLERMPEHPEASQYLVPPRRDDDQKDVVEKDVSSARKAEPEPWVNLTMVSILEKQGAMQEAMVMAEKLFKINPHNKIIHDKLIALRSKNGEGQGL
jgi:tetratricopeptide (TPR) repeat protein